MSDGIPLLDSWITKATVARDALAKAEERIHELEAQRDTITSHVHALVARAEKAEREWDAELNRRKIAEARVAELTERTERAESGFNELNVERDVWMRKMHNGRTCHEVEAEKQGWVSKHWDCGHAYPAREREAD